MHILLTTRIEVIEPVTIQLTGGGTVKRTIEFANIDALNALRMENETFADSCQEIPAAGQRAEVTTSRITSRTNRARQS